MLIQAHQLSASGEVKKQQEEKKRDDENSALNVIFTRSRDPTELYIRMTSRPQSEPHPHPPPDPNPP